MLGTAAAILLASRPHCWLLAQLHKHAPNFTAIPISVPIFLPASYFRTTSSGNSDMSDTPVSELDENLAANTYVTPRHFRADQAAMSDVKLIVSAPNL
jgi:hypothetical protein